MEVLELGGVTPLAGNGPEKTQWDAYVQRAQGATLFHLGGWKEVMEGSFGLQTRFLYARDGSDVRGVLPLLYVKSRLGGHFLTSMPGGMCAEDDLAAQALLDYSRDLLRSVGARYLVLRDGLHRWDAPDLVTDEGHCTLVVKLFADTEKIWRGIKKRARQLTSHAIRAGVEVVDGTDAFERYYPAYSRSMRDKGTPTLGLRFFRSVLAEFPDLFRFLVVRRAEEVIGGGFVTPFRDTVYCTWGGMLRRFYDYRPNHLLFWESLKYAAGKGSGWLDLGRSRVESGTYVFKMNWGAEPRPLYQQYYLNGIDRPPAVGGAREENAKYRAFVAAWKRMPLPLTEAIGPRLRKRMPFG